MWITLTEDRIRTRLTEPELAACRTAALAQGQGDPLPGIIGQVTREIRGYVAGCASNRLGAGQTIPDELESAALALARYYLADRLPVRSLMTEARQEAYRSALAQLRDVAACRFAIERPADVSAERITSPSPRIRPRKLRYTRDHADGI